MPKKNTIEDEGSRRSRTPKGHFVVYVGSEMKRFAVPTSYLKNPLFQNLLDNAAEEYGFDNRNLILLPCDESTFRRLIAILARSNSFNSTRINPN
ncbi:auxin-induced protein X15-like [Lycium ferocissimum]|uniref:auxin-induced protein X15-like n=1 Tax=Lycium ferocissimum TaxID=112874 RepID=UPI002814C9EC|nr:auxin-induced protein X15-like [Lycium ferocissimum]